ncbi:unnamed protein product [Closterium sp. Yama58-4]|nr:unnamed protein product [Closterium sp. Yama58-4]
MAALQRAFCGEERPPCAAANGGTAGAKEDCNAQDDAETPQQKEQRLFSEAVVGPWLKCQKISEAWKIWDKGPALMGGSSIRDLAKGYDFLATFSKFGDQTVVLNMRSKRLGRRRNQMLTIDGLRPDDSEAATAYALALGDWLLSQSSESTIGDGNVVSVLQKRKREVSGDDGITANEGSRNRIVYLLVEAKARDDAWAQSIVGADAWPNIKEREAEQMAKKRKRNHIPPPEPYVGHRS